MTTSLAPQLSGLRNEFQRCWPGLLLACVIAIAAAFIADNRGGPTLLYALLLGMALNTVAMEGNAKAGVDFASRRVLRFGVALLGARITFEQIGAVGWSNGALMVVGVVATIAFGVAAARLFGQSRPLRRADRRRHRDLRRIGGNRDRGRPAA